jgi:hypothetical protein
LTPEYLIISQKAFNIFVGLILFIYVFHFFIAEETLHFSWEVSLGIDATPAQLRTPLEITSFQPAALHHSSHGLLSLSAPGLTFDSPDTV